MLKSSKLKFKMLTMLPKRLVKLFTRTLVLLNLKINNKTKNINTKKKTSVNEMFEFLK